MNDHFYLGAYWGARQEDSTSCARRASIFLQSLERVDELFATWYLKSRAMAKTGRLIPIDPQALADLFAAGVNRRDVDATPIRELGFTITAWAQAENKQTSSLRITCGASNPYVGNACVLEFPEYGPFDANAMIRIVEAAAEAFDPDIVNVNSDEHRNLSGTVEGKSAIGWVAYVSARLGKVPALPKPSRVVSDEHGTLVVVTDEQFSSANERHVAAAASVASILTRSGVLS